LAIIALLLKTKKTKQKEPQNTKKQIQDPKTHHHKKSVILQLYTTLILIFQ